MAQAAVARIRAVVDYVPEVPMSVTDTEFAALRAQGRTGTLADMRHTDLAADSGLSTSLSTMDLDFQYRRTLGQTGTINDMRAYN